MLHDETQKLCKVKLEIVECCSCLHCCPNPWFVNMIILVILVDIRVLSTHVGFEDVVSNDYIITSSSTATYSSADAPTDALQQAAHELSDPWSSAGGSAEPCAASATRGTASQMTASASSKHCVSTASQNASCHEERMQERSRTTCTTM